MIIGYDEWKTNPPEPDPVMKCDCCGGDIWEGDFIYTIDGENLCETCTRDNYGKVV